jgi:glutaredoxin/glutathione-dependent peroxiredoxin
MMLPDGSARFTGALGLTQDLEGKGMGVRGRRFALVARNGRIDHLAVEEPGQFGVSSATAILGVL